MLNELGVFCCPMTFCFLSSLKLPQAPDLRLDKSPAHHTRLQHSLDSKDRREITIKPNIENAVFNSPRAFDTLRHLTPGGPSKDGPLRLHQLYQHRDRQPDRPRVRQRLPVACLLRPGHPRDLLRSRLRRRARATQDRRPRVPPVLGHRDADAELPLGRPAGAGDHDGGLERGC